MTSDTILARLNKCLERQLALQTLPPIKHDMTLPLRERLDTFERLQSERILEGLSIMSEVVSLMREADAVFGTNHVGVTDDPSGIRTKVSSLNS